ncbi:hypothetical protein [Chryseobacterium elymi]|uniref:hypothetical protein n=1 Tax=Chryseobacterium elymi TaxID=395936 RepID=UPI000F4FD376|nr:hypothetical protein [Chryseobacterium elymi]
MNERQADLAEISQHKEFISKARRYLLAGKIDFGDFRDTKKHNLIMFFLNDRLQHLTKKLSAFNSEHADVWSHKRINI